MANDAMKVAVIGGGKIARQHLPVLKDLPEADVVALADSNAQALRECAERFDIAGRWDCHGELLEKERPDAVFVLVSMLAAADVAADFIRAGVPTFLEKPPGLYTWQTRELAELARQHGTPAMVGVNRRFYSSHIRGREILLEVGPVHSVTVEAHEDVERVRTRSKFPPEVVRRWSAANGIHALDLLRFFGGDVASIEAVQRTVEGPGPDCCTAVIDFEQGAVGRALMDWFAPGGHRFEVRTVGATLTGDTGRGRPYFHRRGAEPVVLELDEVDRRYKAGFWKQDQTFLQWARNGGQLPFPGCALDDAVKTMELIDAVSGTRADGTG